MNKKSGKYILPRKGFYLEASSDSGFVITSDYSDCIFTSMRRIIKPVAVNVLYSSSRKSLSDIMEEVFYLSQLNYTQAFGCGMKIPLVLKVSQRALDLVSKPQAPHIKKGESLWFL